MTENVETLVQQMNEDRARRERRKDKAASFVSGVLIGALAVGAAFAVLIVPKTKALAATVAQSQAHDAELQRSVAEAFATLNAPIPDAPLNRQAALALTMLRSSLLGNQRQLANYETQIRALAEQSWQRTVEQNQPVPDDDAIVGILNLVQPGFGTTLKKLYNAKQGIPAN